ncbi:exodeoxyribonuclease V subunit beta [Thiomicrorhabdus sp. Milos-T2]|uniref:UvrD-helicase domain-containing protein n=1 Tax=Thiomicrorhabdus sp. Milos-T2 TaxID=90814 RepID=UPI000494AAD6|nr:UvrD-helicase domain-containing protein [Thiomicrorhabdus sp. Milos-T2]
MKYTDSIDSNPETLPNLTMVKAGAGAGKTFRIQQDLTQWIKDGLIRPDRILAVTFTHAAANEMKERIRQNLIKESMRDEANKVQNATISTIHGFGVEIIESFAYEQGISPKPRQLTEAEQNQLIRKALTQVEAINPLLNNLKQYGYTGNFNGNDYTDGASQLKNRILNVIRNLRSLGKGGEAVSAQSSIDLLEASQLALKDIYGLNLSKAETLNTALWCAINSIHAQYPDLDVLEEQWASNSATRSFLSALREATEENIKTDWKLWTKLQTIATAPKIFGKKQEHEHAHLALAVWQAADKLSVHPGPLDDALKHVSALLISAIESLSLYQTSKQKAGLIDFNDMLHLAEQVLSSSEFLAEAKSNYDCLIIDEFQDTNPLQFSLLRQFQKAGLPTLIVGDLKQSIMGFQGSDSRLFSSLLSEGLTDENVCVDELNNNWRSTPELMRFINAIGNQLYQSQYQSLSVVDEAKYQSELAPVQQLLFNKDNWGAQKSKNKASIQEEGQFALANHINELLQQGIQITDKNTRQKRALKPSDIAVLSPKHSRLSSFSKQLKKLGIQTKLTQPGFLESESVQWVLCGLQFVSNPKNQFALLNLITSEYALVPLQEALKEFIENKHFKHPVVQALKSVSAELRLTDFKTAVITVIELLNIWDKVQTRTDAAQQRANLIKLISLAETFEQAQPESLQAMGIYGKNLETFNVWLKESIKDNQSDMNNQPHIQLNADEAVVLSTWHASKGLEWPIVMVLDAHDDKKPKVPSIDMAYSADDVDGMLESSFVRILMDFDDKTTQQKMLDELMAETTDTLKNLTYVALTRAREQVILPWFDNGKDNSMLSLIAPLFETDKFEYQSKNMVMIVEPEIIETEEEKRRVIKLAQNKQPKAISATISPSLHENSSVTDTILKTTVESYGSGIDLKDWDKLIAANEVGDFMHRFFEIYFMNPALLEKGFETLSNALNINKIKLQIEPMLQSYQAWLNAILKPINIKCEVPILAVNELGQTVSGSIDMLIETETGFWIIDHKTDKKTDFTKHSEQLKAYAQALALDKPIIGIAINWVRTGQFEILDIK